MARTPEEQALFDELIAEAKAEKEPSGRWQGRTLEEQRALIDIVNEAKAPTLSKQPDRTRLPAGYKPSLLKQALGMTPVGAAYEGLRKSDVGTGLAISGIKTGLGVQELLGMGDQKRRDDIRQLMRDDKAAGGLGVSIGEIAGDIGQIYALG